MKTDTTTRIERCLASYAPKALGGIVLNHARYFHTAYEVPVTCGSPYDGLIDCVKAFEYFERPEARICKARTWPLECRLLMENCARGLRHEPNMPMCCGEETCKDNAAGRIYVEKVAIACFEIKVSKADFKSENGHNFVGNLNFYVVPKEMVPEITCLLPDGIGIVSHSNGVLRKVKDCEFRALTDEAQKWLLLSMMKRNYGLCMRGNRQ